MKIQPPPAPAFDATRALALAHDTLDIEAAAVLGLKKHMGDDFVHAVQLVLAHSPSSN